VIAENEDAPLAGMRASPKISRSNGAVMPTFPAKMLAATCAAAVLLALPANAKQQRKHRKYATSPAAAFASPGYHGANLFPPGPVMYGNEYLGNDPDPFIRSQILRDLGAHFGGEN